ncbi:HigA family addiction module antitoxin [Micromonospora radicis]|uniref:Addiction module antidote protein, HigA family n=1 Tax=Micromonospora radicis TaxID=1894971 RepID=A0A418MN32_9ACTN|nr:HigA family addiction module antitoxin [Micromonospora radicis]RIV31338.1 addiction module antidote protein, HigA family [Micromonospora radicis]
MTNTGNTRRFRPDYAVPPGETLVEVLTERGMSQADLARRTGLSTKHINQIVLGTATLSAETAVRLELVTGVAAQVWTGLEAAYQVAQTRLEETTRLQAHVDWLNQLPVAELIRRGFVRSDTSPVERLREVLAFFKVASPDAWHQVWAVPTAYRQSRAFDVDYGALAAWLRIGEIRADRADLPPFDRSRFRDHLPRIRALTNIEDPQIWLAQLESLCAGAGVALVVEREIVGARINGAVRWLPSERPLIQLSVRHRWADIFWFTFFHEAAHVLLHDRRRFTIVDGIDRPDTDNAMELEADDFAGRVLLPRPFDSRLATVRSQAQAVALAKEAGVHPGIVVGRLQHDKTIPYSHFNRLRTRLAFTDE